MVKPVSNRDRMNAAYTQRLLEHGIQERSANAISVAFALAVVSLAEPSCAEELSTVDLASLFSTQRQALASAEFTIKTNLNDNSAGGKKPKTALFVSNALFDAEANASMRRTVWMSGDKPPAWHSTVADPVVVRRSDDNLFLVPRSKPLTLYWTGSSNVPHMCASLPQAVDPRSIGFSRLDRGSTLASAIKLLKSSPELSENLRLREIEHRVELTRIYNNDTVKQVLVFDRSKDLFLLSNTISVGNYKDGQQDPREIITGEYKVVPVLHEGLYLPRIFHQKSYTFRAPEGSSDKSIYNPDLIVEELTVLHEFSWHSVNEVFGKNRFEYREINLPAGTVVIDARGPAMHEVDRISPSTD